MTGIYKVYVLYSEKHHRSYIGQTNNLEQRVIRHNRGLVNSTKAFRPWRVIYSEDYESRSEAMRREKWLKSGTGRIFIKRVIASA